MNHFAEIRSLFSSGILRLPCPIAFSGARRGVAKWPVWLAFVLLVLAPPAPALTINATYDSSVTSLPNAAEVQAAFAVAVQTFQNLYTNAVTINLNVYWGNTGPFTGGISLGANSSALLGFYTYAQVTNALRAARTSAADYSSVASLPANNPSPSGNWIASRAEDKVLGLGFAPPNDLTRDGDVGFASTVSFTFDPTNRSVPGKFDFIGVAEHEIAEVLGRNYSLGLLGSALLPNDLFRFTANGTRSFNPDASNVYFSVDNGATASKFFYTNRNLGDIQDWLSSGTPDAFDAFSSSGHILPLSPADIIALDVLGYNSPGVTAAQLTATKLTNGTFQISFTNLTSTSFTVLASTNLNLPASNWTVLGTATENPVGQYKYNDPQAATFKQRFYRVRSP